MTVSRIGSPQKWQSLELATVKLKRVDDLEIFGSGKSQELNFLRVYIPQFQFQFKFQFQSVVCSHHGHIFSNLVLSV